MSWLKPWDAHAQSELANANATYHTLWNLIGDTYPGNPFMKQVRGPAQAPVLSDDELVVVDGEEMVVGDDAVVASTDDVVAPYEESAAVSEAAPEITPE